MTRVERPTGGATGGGGATTTCGGGAGAAQADRIARTAAAGRKRLANSDFIGRLPSDARRHTQQSSPDEIVDSHGKRPVSKRSRGNERPGNCRLSPLVE